MGYLKKHRWTALFLLIILDIFIGAHMVIASGKTLRVVMLDIGQGDAIYIEAPNGRQVMFDAGPDQGVLKRLGEVMPALDRSLDVLVVTNPDKDHIGGFVPILERYDVGAVLEPGTFNESKTYATLEEVIRSKKIPDIVARRGMKLVLDEKNDVYIDIIFPDRDVRDWTSNDGSIVARLVYGDDSMLLMGDATKMTEGIVLAENGAALESDVLKVGHHGSRTSTGADFVKAVASKYALISDGKNNKYGHPHKETIDTLTSVGVRILRTDLLGTIEICSTGEGFKVIE